MFSGSRRNMCLCVQGQGLRHSWQEADSRRLSHISMSCFSRGMISLRAKEADSMALSDCS